MDASNRRPRSTSRSRPTTPLRPSSRSSIRDAPDFATSSSRPGSRSAYASQPAVNALEPQFAELADSMADLEANLMHLQLMHESLSRFNESFASFLYGMNMNAFCVDFPEAPIPDSFRRAKDAESTPAAEPEAPPANEGETSILTTDTTFIDNPPATSKTASSYATPATATTSSARATRGSARGRYSTRGASSGRRGTMSSSTRSRARGGVR